MPRKRWMTLARPAGLGWRLSAPEPVGVLSSWMRRLRESAGAGAIALGVDLPLGVPRAYAAEHVSESDFPAFLRALAARPGFFQVCPTLSDLSGDRPFYPARGVAGMTRASHAQALRLGDAAGLQRWCDRATATRPAGAPLFWTLGANQTGKAAITAWRDWLLPALAEPNPPRLWPFEGGFHQLLTGGHIVVAETYPAEVMRQRGLKMGGSKRKQADRAALAPALRDAAEVLGAELSADLQATLSNGFGADANGEDRFDSFIGVLGVLSVLTGQQPDCIPDDPALRQWEGWVLGQTELPSI